MRTKTHLRSAVPTLFRTMREKTFGEAFPPMPNAPTYTPLTDAELDFVEHNLSSKLLGILPRRITAEIRALRASEARLLAALKEAERSLARRIESHIYYGSEKQVLEQVRAAIAAAEGRAEG